VDPASYEPIENAQGQRYQHRLAHGRREKGSATSREEQLSIGSGSERCAIDEAIDPG
jgi:hypothetical protein